MKTIKLKPLAIIMLSASIALASPVSALADGIPTVDWAAVAKAKEQIDNQIKQIQQLKEQVAALKGVRNIGSIDTKALKNNLPQELKDLYKQAGISISGTQAGKNYAKTVQSSNKVLSEQMQNLSRFLANNRKRLGEIQRLTNLAKQAPDLKTAADLRNQISSYTTQLQNQQIEIENTERLYRMQKEVERKQRVALEACQIKHISSGKFDECTK